MSAGSMGVEYKEPTIEHKVEVLWSKYIRDYETTIDKKYGKKLSVLDVMDIFEKEFRCSGLDGLSRSFAWLGFLGAYQQLNFVGDGTK